MNKKPKLLIRLCAFLLVIGSVLLVNSIISLNNAEKVANYAEPIIREDCWNSNLTYLESLRCNIRTNEDMMENIEKNVAFRSQLESKAYQNTFLAILLIICGIVGLHYFNNIYMKEEK